MEDMGMTNEQWYADIRNQIEDWEDVRELIQQTPDSPEKELALKKIDRTLRRLRENLEKYNACRFKTAFLGAGGDCDLPRRFWYFCRFIF